MDFFDALHSRRSIRSYQARELEPEHIQTILEAINLSPSAGNLQGYEVYVVKKLEDRQALAQAAYGQNFLAVAPVVFVFCTNANRSAVRYHERGRHLYAVQDATIACTQAMLAATALGLGSVWVGAFDDHTVHQIIKAPEELWPIAILPVGYPAEQPAPRPRRTLQDLIHWL